MSFFCQQSTAAAAMIIDGSKANQTLLINTASSLTTQNYRLYATGDGAVVGALTATNLTATSAVTAASMTINAGTALGLTCNGWIQVNNAAATALSVSGGVYIDGGTSASTPLQVRGTGSGTALSVTSGNITCNTPGINSGVVTCLTLSSANKTFDIPHPTKAGLRLRHRCSESDKARLYYEFTLDYREGLNARELPEWFDAMNAEPRVYCSPVRHFGQAWGEVVAGQLQVTASCPGEFNVMVTGVRNDPAAIDEWEHFGVEHSYVAPQ
jgi:hypothetical protein